MLLQRLHAGRHSHVHAHEAISRSGVPTLASSCPGRGGCVPRSGQRRLNSHRCEQGRRSGRARQTAISVVASAAITVASEATPASSAANEFTTWLQDLPWTKIATWATVATAAFVLIDFFGVSQPSEALCCDWQLSCDPGTDCAAPKGGPQRRPLTHHVGRATIRPLLTGMQDAADGQHSHRVANIVAVSSSALRTDKHLRREGPNRQSPLQIAMGTFIVAFIGNGFVASAQDSPLLSKLSPKARRRLLVLLYFTVRRFLREIGIPLAPGCSRPALCWPCMQLSHAALTVMSLAKSHLSWQRLAVKYLQRACGFGWVPSPRAFEHHPQPRGGVHLADRHVHRCAVDRVGAGAVRSVDDPGHRARGE